MTDALKDNLLAKQEENKSKYEEFCRDIYIPIYSKRWWLDAICKPQNWNVWLYETDNGITAAMPYYIEDKGEFTYITKAPLTQNNGILFKYPDNCKETTRLMTEERVIDAACDFIASLGIDVYEQQYQTSFTNWLPFFWNYYEATTRYTYVFTKERLQNLDEVWNEINKKKRNKIKKGLANCKIVEDLAPELFYKEVEKTFAKQGLSCPFSYDLWMRLYTASKKHDSGKIIYAVNNLNEVVSAVFLVWDDERMYQLISGGDVDLQNYEGKSALVWHAIQECSARNLTYDFEGSVIKRISKSNRLFGADPVPYFRIRKVFNPKIIEIEMKEKINMAKKLGGGIE